MTFTSDSDYIRIQNELPCSHNGGGIETKFLNIIWPEFSLPFWTEKRE
jgi:hypothetical protein